MFSFSLLSVLVGEEKHKAPQRFMSLSKQESLLEMELSCSICQQLYMDPVCLPCGHNYCLACIQNATDVSGAQKTVHRCPECRDEYGGTDALQKNFKLRSIIEGYKATAYKLSVLCDHCLDTESPAVKTCLKCEVSLCARHLHRHSERQSFQNHDLVDPQSKLSVTGCAVHGRLLEYFCSSDTTALCASCFVEGVHHNHDVLTIDAAEAEMRQTLEGRCKEVADRMQMTGILLQRAAEEQRPSYPVADKMSKSVALMDKMVALVQCYRDRINILQEEETNQQKGNWQSSLQLLQEQQQQLKEAHQSTTEVLAVTDTFKFIHRYLVVEPEFREVVKGTMATMPNKAPINKRLLTDLKIDDFKMEMGQLLHELNISYNFLELTFNINTAHPNLLLSNDRLTVKYSSSKQAYGDVPERFCTVPQVLCSQCFTSGEHSWELEMGEHSMWSVGLCYSSLPRKGDLSRLGRNFVSWRLQWKNKKLMACHASSNVVLSETIHQPLRIEVALDYERGTLIFHSTKGSREHLYTFRATFREPVYPAFGIHSTTAQSWITLQSGM